MTARYTRGVLAVAGLCTTAAFLQAQTALQINTDSLPPASVGAPYNQQLDTSGGLCSSSTGTPSYKIDAGALPTGILVTSPPAARQWSLQGTPTTAGTFAFTLHVFWTHARVSPFDHDCVDDAAKALTLTVTGTSQPPPPPTNQTLSVDRTQITATWHVGTFPPAPDSVQVTAGGGAVVFTAQAVADPSGTWLSVSPQGATTPSALSISYSVSGLAPGTYAGRVILATGGVPTLIIQVTLQVVTDTNVQLLAAPSSLLFSAALGGPDPPAQSVTVTVVGLSRLFEATVSAPPNGKWLIVTPSAAATTATLTVEVATKDLPAAVYSGVITLAVNGVPNSSVTIPVTFTIQAPAQKPTIAAGGVVDAAGGGRAFAPGTWVSLFGTSLATTSRAWRDADFVKGQLPIALDGVSVTIDGKPAAVAFISPLQINVLAGDGATTGLVPVQVKNALGTSDSVLALQQTAAPALFQQRAATANYAAATHADGSYVAGPALVQQGIPGTPAKVGETIVLFGTGFGATDPPISATSLLTVALPLARPQDLHVRIGGLDAVIAFAGLISPGVYQFNVVVPQAGAGDQPVVAELRGLLTQSNLLLTIQP
jgi:uncharacterized protein (TIGR03437 family)